MGAVRVAITTQPLLLSVSNAGGTAVGLWSDAGLSSLVTQPVTVSSTTTYYVRDGLTMVTLKYIDGTTALVADVQSSTTTSPVEVAANPTLALLSGYPGLIDGGSA